MKKLLITLMLISPFSFADWGDVYYCQITTMSTTSLQGKRTDHIVEKFQFKLDKTKNAMVFGKSGYFEDSVMELREGANWPSQESWFADGEYDISYFDEGKYLYSRTGVTGITSISADCDKF
tara:strand:- start:62 stop:427 length:366 start_codon:yes stop_codon:yes gene_type:complete